MGAEAPARSKSADLVLLVLTAFWGLTFVIVKDALDRSDPFTWLLARFLFGAVVATVVARKKLLDRRLARRGTFLGLTLFVGFAFQTWGLTLTTPARSAFVTGTYVLFVPVAQFLFFRRRPHPLVALGVAVALVGLWLLAGPGAAGGGHLAGDLLTLGCAMAFALHILFTGEFAQGAPPLALVAFELWPVALLSAVALPAVDHHLRLSAGWVLAAAACGVLASALAIAVQTWGQARTGAVRAALIFSTEPVFAAAFSAALGREQLTARTITGGALLLGAVLLAEGGPVLLARRSAASDRRGVLEER